MKTTNLQSELRDFFFRSNPVPMFLYDMATLRLIAANSAAQARYGYRSHEFRRMSVRELRPAGTTAALDSSLLLDPDSPSSSLWTHATRDGKLFPVEVRILPLERGHRKLALMSAIDASACSETRLRLVRSEEVHRALVEECPFGICRYNLTTHRYEQANEALLRQTGYSPEDFCSAHPPSFHLDPEERLRFLDEVTTRGHIHNFEMRWRRKDGSIMRAAISGYLRNNSETGHQYIQAYILDVTRQRELEERLSHSHRMEAVGRLAGGVAHDFNNITQSIHLACELALQDLVSAATESKLLDIMQQASRAAEITRQLLAFSRRQVLQPRNVSANECVRNALGMLTRAVGIDVTIELDLDESASPVFVDPEQLTLVLMHLADNARTAMPSGGVLRVATARGSGSPEASGAADECTILTISDTGCGMEESTRRHIFEPFFSTKDTTRTTGLGLSTVHGIIAQSRGRVECSSSPGIGTTFRIYLPTALPENEPSLVRRPHRDSVRLLLAEDDPVVNKHLTRALEHEGFEVSSARNGEEALESLSRSSYDLLITDIIMPHLNGVELTRRVRHQYPSMPVVLISGFNEEINVLQNLPPGQITYLQKPFAISSLVGAINNLMEEPETDQRRA